jgi:alpha-1,2-mannosyltransferase
MPTAFVDLLRKGDFVNAERLRLIPSALLLGYAIALLVLFASAHGATDFKGRPLGTDFSNVYAAGHAALHGSATAPFDPTSQYAEEKSLFGPATPFYGWHYPPYFLLIAVPLALLPYLWALAVWQLATLALYLGALSTLLRTHYAGVLRSHWLLLAIAFPAAFVNLTHGNNGFLTAALLASALACLDKRPTIAGILFGLLAYKPQFSLMIPLALLVAQRWRVLAAAASTVIALSLLVTAVFGVDVWGAFLTSTHFARTVVLEQGNTGFEKIQSVFAWVRLWGGSVPLAYILQGVTTLAVAAGLIAAWRRQASFADRGAILCLAAILATPYCLDYDLVALAPAIALLAAQGMERGFRPYEKTVLAALWMVPIATRGIAGATLLPIGVWTVLATAALVAWHAVRPDTERSNFEDSQANRKAQPV